MKVNINQICKVVLRQRGIDALTEYYLPREGCRYCKIGDVFERPLWEIMNIFGNMTYMGPEPPFDPEIELKDL